jgi:hypothetical protein
MLEIVKITRLPKVDTLILGWGRMGNLLKAHN